MSSAEQAAQLVRYTTLCDILGGCGQLEDRLQVAEFLTRKLKYVVNAYGWTYHTASGDTLELCARINRPVYLGFHADERMKGFRGVCESIASIQVIDAQEEPVRSHLASELVVRRLREVLIFPVKRQGGIQAYFGYYSKDTVFDDLDRKFIVLISDFIHDRMTAIGTSEKLQASLVELANREKYLSYKTISLSMAHHVNTPLGTAATCNSLIGSQVATLTKAVETRALTASNLSEALRDIEEAQRHADENLTRIAKLIDGFRESCTQVEDSSSEMFDFGEVLQKVIDNLKMPLEVVVHPFDDFLIEGRRSDLESVLLELLTNVVKHGGQPSETETGLGLQRIAEVRVRSRTSAVEVVIIDNGEGVSETIRSRIFEPFFVGVRTGQSQGLGLYNVYNTMTNIFGGLIRCEPSEEGARFVLSFPAPE